jgi:uncharacterized protein (DUF1800 family)
MKFYNISTYFSLTLAIILIFTLINLPRAVAAYDQDSNPQINQSSGQTLPAKPQRSGPLSADEKMLQVLNRLGYGPRPGDLLEIKRVGLEKYIDQQLQPQSLEDRGVESRLAGLKTLQMNSRELAQAYPLQQAIQAAQQRQQAARERIEPENSGREMDDNNPANNNLPAEKLRQPRTQINLEDVQGQPRQILVELSQQQVLRAVYSNRQLQEVMANFWFNHFNVFWAKNFDRYLVTPYWQEVIHPQALSSFPKLLSATAHSPAMLVYLDNWLSVDPQAAERLQAERQERRERLEQRRGGRNPLGFPGGIGGRGGRGGQLGQRRVPPLNAPPLGGNNPGAQRPFPNDPNNPQSQVRQQRRAGLNENYARELLELHTLGVDGGYTQKDVTEVARCFTGWTVQRGNEGGQFFFNERLHDDGEKVVLGVKIPAGGGKKDGEKVLELLAKHPSTARFIATKLVRHFVADEPPTTLVDRVAATYTKTNGQIPAMLKTIFTSSEFFARENYQAKIKSPLALVVSAMRATNAETDVNPQLLLSLGKMGQPLFLCQPPTGYGDIADTWINSAALIERLNFATALCQQRIPGTTPRLSNEIGNVRTLDQLIKQLMYDDVSAGTRQALEQELGSQSITPEKLPKLTGLLLGSPDFQRR